VEEHGDLVFFVMAYVDGDTLGEQVRRNGPLPAADIMRVTQEIAWALGHAHGRGVVHRDVKPDNVLLEREGGRAMVTDFGIARPVETGDTPHSGQIRGTPQYMSPEQAAGGAVDARSDLYSLGVTAFLAASGRLPFEAGSVAGYVSMHASESAPPVASLAPRLPARFAAAVDRCLAKDPADRPAAAEELAWEINAARGALVHVPAPLARFAREAGLVGSEAGGYLAGIAAMVVPFEVFKLFEGDFLGLVTAIEILMAALIAGLSATRVAQLVGRTRELRRQGYDHRALKAVLELEERRLREEESATAAPSRSGTWATAGVGAAATAAGLLAMSAAPDFLVVVGTALTVGAPLVTVRRLWDRLGGGRLWARLLRGRFGRALFRLGGIGVKDAPATLPAAGERTEVALGRVAAELFAALPEGQRQGLGDVPGLIDRLEADALALRGRVADSDASARLATTVAALEALRLDLLRLDAGTGSLDELTQDLEAARRIGEEIDAEVQARREVSQL
jgi:serine/threonine-protein kinase